MSNPARDVFNAGFAAAVAMLARDHNEDALAWFLLRDAGGTLADYRAADDHDRAELSKLFAANGADV